MSRKSKVTSWRKKPGPQTVGWSRGTQVITWVLANNHGILKLVIDRNAKTVESSWQAATWKPAADGKITLSTKLWEHRWLDEIQGGAKDWPVDDLWRFFDDHLAEYLHDGSEAEWKGGERAGRLWDLLSGSQEQTNNPPKFEEPSLWHYDDDPMFGIM